MTLDQGHNDPLKRETLKEIWIQAQRNTTKAVKSHKVTRHQPTWTTTTMILQESILKGASSKPPKKFGPSTEGKQPQEKAGTRSQN